VFVFTESLHVKTQKSKNPWLLDTLIILSILWRHQYPHEHTHYAAIYFRNSKNQIYSPHSKPQDNSPPKVPTYKPNKTYV
jgi:hypothetical protein